MKKPSWKQLKPAFTLLEALLAAAVLAMAITAILMPFTAGTQQEQVDARRTLAVNLAEEMMEEILAKPFRDPDGATSPGPEPGETSRSEFDNLDDYDGYTEPEGGVTSFDGGIVSDPAAVGLSRYVSAGYVYVSGQDTAEEPTFVRVCLVIKFRGSPVVTLTRLVYDLNGEEG